MSTLKNLCMKNGLCDYIINGNKINWRCVIQIKRFISERKKSDDGHNTYKIDQFTFKAYKKENKKTNVDKIITPLQRNNSMDNNDFSHRELRFSFNAIRSNTIIPIETEIYNESKSRSQSQSVIRRQSRSHSRSYSHSTSQSGSKTHSASQSHSMSQSESKSHSASQTRSQSKSESTSHSQSKSTRRSKSNRKSKSNNQSQKRSKKSKKSNRNSRRLLSASEQSDDYLYF